MVRVPGGNVSVLALKLRITVSEHKLLVVASFPTDLVDQLWGEDQDLMRARKLDTISVQQVLDRAGRPCDVLRTLSEQARPAAQ